jgi:hypothetical protein
MKLNWLHGAHCNHRRVGLHNKPGSPPLIERAGQMKIEGGIHGRKLLEVAVSLASTTESAVTPL